jgi:hypothetical protein
MFSIYSPYSISSWNQPAYQENFIDGPMMPKEKEKKKKKKKKKVEKEKPVMDSIEQALEKMKIRFDEIEKEHLGPKRGIRTVKWIAGRKCEGLHKTVTTKMANSILNSWVYCRHALMHGHYQLNDMTKKELAESILGKGTKTKIPDRDARLILKELFRFGKSPQLDRYMKEHLEKMKIMGRQIVAEERNRMGIPKIRNLATVEEMAQHGYTQEEIDSELLSRVKKDENRRLKRIRTEMPAYLRNEVSGARRQEARKVERILKRKEKKRLLRQQEYEARFGKSPPDSAENATVGGEEDTDVENDSSDYDSDDNDEDTDYGEENEVDSDEDIDDDDDDDDDEGNDDDKDDDDNNNDQKDEKYLRSRIGKNDVLKNGIVQDKGNEKLGTAGHDNDETRIEPHLQSENDTSLRDYNDDRDDARSRTASSKKEAD